MPVTQRCDKEPYRPHKRPLLTPRHKVLRLEWAKKYMKSVILGHCRFRRQQGGGGIMIWAGIIGDELIRAFRVPDEVKRLLLRYIAGFLSRICSRYG